MLKNYTIKILSVVFFLIAVFAVKEIFVLSEYKDIDNELIIRYGILLFSLFVLFGLVFFKQTKTVFKEKIIREKQKKEDDSENERIKSETENKVSGIISLISENYAENNLAEIVLKAFAEEFYIVQGIFYYRDNNIFKTGYSYALSGNKKYSFKEGEGITGQVALNKKIKIMTDIPEDYIQVVSGLGAGTPKNIVFIPVVKNGETAALIEIALFDDFPQDFEKYYLELNKEIANKIK